MAQDPEKSTFEIEEELIEELGEREIKSKEDEAKEESDLTVEGEDELFIRSRKEFMRLLSPQTKGLSTWKDEEEKVVTIQTKGEPKKVERLADISAFYGQYNSLYIDGAFRKGSPISAHSIQYRRTKFDSEGFNFKGIENSSRSTDLMLASNMFRISDEYRFFLKVYYLEKTQGLHSNPFLLEQTKKTWFLDWSNQIHFSKQRIKVSINAKHINSEAEKVDQGEERGGYTAGNIDGSWEYFFGKRNTLGADMDLFIAKNQLYYAREKQYRVGDIGFWLLMPVYSAFFGEEEPTSWDVHIKLRQNFFLSQGSKLILKPHLTIQSKFGIWNAELGFLRESSIPDIDEKYLKQDYFKPVSFDAPEDAWKAYLSNRFSLDLDLRFIIEGGFYYHRRYYFPSLQQDQLYTYDSQRLRIIYAEFGWEHSPIKMINYLITVHGEYLLDQVYFHLPVYLECDINFFWRNFGLELELEFSGKRKTPQEELKPYVLLHLGLFYQFTPLTRFYLKAQNALNQEYIIFPTYRTSGVVLMGGFKLKL